MLKNERIKASEVRLIGVDGEDLGVVPIAEALAEARRLGVDLVCESLYSSPPPCRLIGEDAAKRERQRERKLERPPKVKEIRLTTGIEEHDYDTKKTQAERILKAGDEAELVVKLQGKEGDKARALLERLAKELSPFGRKRTGVQVSGKSASVRLEPIGRE